MARQYFSILAAGIIVIALSPSGSQAFTFNRKLFISSAETKINNVKDQRILPKNQLAGIISDWETSEGGKFHERWKCYASKLYSSRDEFVADNEVQLGQSLGSLQKDIETINEKISFGEPFDIIDIQSSLNSPDNNLPNATSTTIKESCCSNTESLHKEELMANHNESRFNSSIEDISHQDAQQQDPYLKRNNNEEEEEGGEFDNAHTLLREQNEFQSMKPSDLPSEFWAVWNAKAPQNFRGNTPVKVNVVNDSDTDNLQETIGIDIYQEASDGDQEFSIPSSINDERDKISKDPLVRKYQNRSILLEAALVQKSQQLRKYQRRLIVLQDMMQRIRTEASETSPLVLDASSSANLLDAEINRIKLEYQVKEISYNTTKEKLSGTITKLQNKILELEQLAANEQTVEADIKALEQQLRYEQNLYVKEKEYREAEQKRHTRELQAATQETLKVEKILFNMEAELKSRRQEFEEIEAKLQAELKKERKQSKALKSKLQITLNRLKESLARPARPQNITSPLEPETIYINDDESVKIAEAAVLASQRRESKLKDELAELRAAYKALQDDNESLMEQKDEIERDSLTFKEKNERLERLLEMQRENFAKKEQEFKLQIERLERTTDNEGQIIEILESEKAKLSDLWLREKRLRFSDLERQRSSYEQVLVEERMARQVQLDLLESRLRKLQQTLEMNKESSYLIFEGGEEEESAVSFKLKRTPLMQRIRTYLRRLRDRAQKLTQIIDPPRGANSRAPQLPSDPITSQKELVGRKIPGSMPENR